ncbi:hypothetical protein V6N13_020954 [Hibiscus sabdariffa]|uniref:Uncharacterized protein n=1 Tax=Hibiscus sabdariffa TaxID=183260 RepID=A0ABR2EX50_9ROSI
MGLVSGILIGMILGILLMAACAYMVSYRSTMRMAKAAYIKAFGALNRDDVEKICGDNYPHWISFPVLEQVEWLNRQLSKLWPCIAEPKPIIDFSVKAEGSLTAIPGISDMIDQISNVVESFIAIPGVSEMINQSLKAVESFKAVPGISYMIGNTMNVVDGSLTAIPGISNLVSTIATHVLQWPKRVVPIGSVPVDTRSHQEQLDPVWNETFELIAQDKDTQELTVLSRFRTTFSVPHFAAYAIIVGLRSVHCGFKQVFDQGILLAERLGIAKFRLTELEPGTQKEVTLTHMLKDKDNKNVGSCAVKLLYHQFSKEE